MTERHCDRCGNLIPEGSDYCPTCGAGIDGCSPTDACIYRGRKGYDKKEDDLSKVPLMMIVYGIIALVGGLLMFYNGSTIESSWTSIADSEGLYAGLTMDQFVNLATRAGMAFIISGVCALISGFLANKRMMYVPCIALCIVSSVSVMILISADIMFILFSIILMVIGLMMAMKIRNNRDSFY